MDALSEPFKICPGAITMTSRKHVSIVEDDTTEKSDATDEPKLKRKHSLGIRGRSHSTAFTPGAGGKAGAAGSLFDALFVGFWVMGSLHVLSVLDKFPMPSLGVYLGQPDVRFYCPPHAAIAFAFFNAPSVPSLFQVAGGLLVAAAAAIVVTEGSAICGDVCGFDQPHVRCLAAGLAAVAMKLTNTPFPPACAVAVLFVDNAVLGKLGRVYICMPGLTGTAVLFLLAAVKVRVVQTYNAYVTDAKKDD